MIHSLSILQMNVVDLYNAVIDESRRNPAIELVESNKNFFKNDKNYSYLESIKDKPSIENYILEQVLDWPQDKKDILLEIIYNLDDNGFFCGDFTQLASKLHVDNSLVSAISEELKNLRPYGLSSKNLQEALIVQTNNILTDENTKAKIITLINKHLDDLLHGFFKKIARVENLSIREVEKIGRFILKLNFSPLSFFHSEDNVAIIPDVRIFKQKDEWIVEINEEYYPQMRFSKIYKEIGTMSDEYAARKFLKDCARRARMLSNAINKRNVTLYNISCAILNHQKQFFEFGPKWLQGLCLRDIAEELHINISTVSRAIVDKYIDTPFGTKKMTTFFETNIAGYSSTFIKAEIRKILKQFNTRLSDQKITDILNDRGIKIARRTVTKYRQRENLPNSRIRKIV